MTPHAGTPSLDETDGIQTGPSGAAGVASRDGDIDKLVSQRLRAARLANGLSQTRLAERVGLSLQQVHKYETARNRIGPARLVQFAHTLGVPIDWLFGGFTVESNQIPNEANRDVVAFVAAFRQIQDTRQRAAALALLRSLGNGTPRKVHIGGDKIETRQSLEPE